MQSTKGSRKNSNIAQPFFQKWYGFFLVLLAAFAIADLLILNFRDLMLPTQSPPSRAKSQPPNPVLNRDVFQNIVKRNIFSALDVIPPELRPKGEDPQQREQAPIPTTLPLGLVGTLVHSTPEKSLAAVELKTKSNQVLSFSPGKEIDGMATVEKVERGKVIIRNINTGRLEFIEMKTAAKLSFGTAPKVEETGPKEVKKTGSNQFEITKTDLKKYTDNLSGILMKARAVPARRPGSGEIYGWRLLEIEAGSIFEHLGLTPGDTITGVNGNAVTSAQQAMETYGALKNANSIEIQVERGGKTETLRYKIVN